MGDTEITVTVRTCGHAWAWEARYDGDLVCKGTTASVPRALRLARREARRSGYEFERLHLLEEHEDEYGKLMVYGVDIDL